MRDQMILVEWIEELQLAFLPGGRQEDSESLVQALLRELTEEISGLELEIGEYLGRIAHRWTAAGGSDSCLNHFYAVRIVEDRGVAAREAGRTLQWLALDSAQSALLKPPSLLRMLRQESPGRSWDLFDTETQ